MASIVACEIPPASFLGGYHAGEAYADCYVTDIGKPVSQAQFVEAFYTTRLFKIERLILRLAISRPSTDDDVRALACGQRDEFAAWRVERRSEAELLLAAGRTRSWLMAVPLDRTATKLYFGSAVVPGRRAGGKRGSMGLAFQSLLGFHKLYSRVLLHAARSRLEGLALENMHRTP